MNIFCYFQCFAASSWSNSMTSFESLAQLCSLKGHREGCFITVLDFPLYLLTVFVAVLLLVHFFSRNNVP